MKLVAGSVNLHIPTRGRGLLEPYLARRRAEQADQLIPSHLRNGSILDIGCGSYPYFLSHTYFGEKCAIDKHEPKHQLPDIRWHCVDINRDSSLPFRDQSFNTVTMLAVVEHLNPSGLAHLFQEIYRILRPGGLMIITTPAAWSDHLLHLMARINLVSAEEIHEHMYSYTLPLLGWYFGRAEFEMTKIRFGYFESFLNMWATAER